MFERRLKIFFGLIIAVTLLLLARAAQVQVIGSGYWKDKARENLKRSQLVETVRGRILDFKGRELAVDQPCIDAAVDYRAIIREAAWLKTQAIARLKADASSGYARTPKAQRGKLIEQETRRVEADIDRMWQALAAVSGKPREQIDEVVANVRRRVEMRRRYIWYRKYEQAMNRHGSREPAPWYKQWLLNEEPTPQLDSFAIDVSEQTDAHVILTAITPEAHIALKKRLEEFPGLVLRPSKHRFYPYGSVACHVLGHLANVSREDQQADPNLHDELRHYLPNDLIGRAGVESLAEQLLRGTRGRIERIVGHDGIVGSVEPQGGKDVRVSIDIELQREMENAFRRVEFFDKQDMVVEAHEMHGAAIVLDIPTNQVRALVSYPLYDLNKLADEYAQLALDHINEPMLNRATMMALEPGSTVKPMVGLGAVTQGLITPDSTIECTGFMKDSHGHDVPFGRCWVATRFLGQLGREGVKHHQCPTGAEHPTGFLTLTDAIQRSCNVFFETLGERLGLQGLSYWFERFGVGRKTGIGLTEVAGHLPNQAKPEDAQALGTAWFCAIGQSQVLATPIQMANVAATIARNGLWMRPRLLAEEKPAAGNQVDLRLSPAGLAAVREGMCRVVNTLAGSGYHYIRRSDVVIAGKTGTAQAGEFSIVERDADGHAKRDENGHLIVTHPPLSTLAQPNPQMPWYRGSGTSGKDRAHAWFIGFAPADRPRIAFAVVLEYGGGGGSDAAPIVQALLDACIRHGYLLSEAEASAPARDRGGR